MDNKDLLLQLAKVLGLAGAMFFAVLLFLTLTNKI
jgi:hypothetical protein